MALNKQPIAINFAQGVNTKTDPFQVPIGQFLSLKNSVFNKGGLLQKRNGYNALPTLPDTTSTFVTTFNDNLTAIGTRFNALSSAAAKWVDKGAIQPVTVNTLPVIRNNLNQVAADTAVAPNGLMCTVYTENSPSGVGTHKYVVADSVTGQNILPPALIPVSVGATIGSSRVFFFNNNFVILISNNIGGTFHLQYLTISAVNPTGISAETDISAQYTPHIQVSFDAAVVNDRFYVAWNGSDVGGAIRMRFLTTAFVQSNQIVFSTFDCNELSMAADLTGTTPVIYVSFYSVGSNNGHTFAVDQNLNTVFAPVLTIAGTAVANLTSTATGGVCTLFFEITNAYTYDSAIPTNFLDKVTVTQAGVVSSVTTLLRSVGLASKAFVVNSVVYLLTVYQSTFQSTFFLIDAAGNVIAKLAYENARGYLQTGLPSVTVTDDVAQVAYLVKDLIEAANKTQGAANASPVYSQTGINLVSFTIDSEIHSTAEIGHDLYVTGGFLWMYDGYTPVEHLFHLWPDSVEATWSATGGSIAAQPDGATNTNAYFYQVTYEWMDNQGNIFRSAPSVPISVTTTGTGSTGSITINVPTLRLTYKISSPVKIVIYRWSIGQQIYYQTTTVTAPVLNDTTVDSVQFVDTHSDAQILGSNIIYTTGGVLENIAAPSVLNISLFDDRLFYISAEDQNLLGYSKQVIESTPVETSDLLTIFVAPNIGAQGPTGTMKCIAPMDDKLIIYKKDAILYINGTGPDNTGANSQYSQPVLITATVGSSNQKSIVFTPNGLMFESDKGIWLLGRDLSTSYIGAPVESFTQGATVQSAVSVPGTNQIRFTLDSGITLMYDYFYGQWGTFVNVPAISSTLYQGLHTYIDSFGQVFQESLGKYLDGSNPVLMSFVTSWLNVAGLQGFERAYELFILATYISPHKLQVMIGYDYNGSPSQSTIITPDNFAGVYGSDPLYGDSALYGGPGNIEQWRIFFRQQKCEAFQVSIQEVFDPSFGTVAGAGLTMSGMNATIGVKDGKPRLRASRQAG